MTHVNVEMFIAICMCNILPSNTEVCSIWGPVIPLGYRKHSLVPWSSQGQPGGVIHPSHIQVCPSSQPSAPGPNISPRCLHSNPGLQLLSLSSLTPSFFQLFSPPTGSLLFITHYSAPITLHAPGFSLYSSLSVLLWSQHCLPLFWLKLNQGVCPGCPSWLQCNAASKPISPQNKDTFPSWHRSILTSLRKPSCLLS